MGVSFGIGSYIEGGVVAGIIGLNIVIGFMQEYSAEKTLDSLRSLSSPSKCSCERLLGLKSDLY
jgi:P-type Na+/K+ transporter